MTMKIPKLDQRFRCKNKEILDTLKDRDYSTVSLLYAQFDCKILENQPLPPGELKLPCER